MKCKYCSRSGIPDDAIFCCYCGEKIARRKKTPRTEIKVPAPRQLKSGAWNIELRKEGASITEATRDACLARARAIRAGFLVQEKAPPALTLEAAITKYIDSRRGTVSPSTVATYEKKKRLYFKALQQENIHDLTEAKIQTEIAGMVSRGLSAKTVHDTVLFISSVLQHSGCQLDTGKLSLPQVQASPYSVLTPEEIRTLLAALPGNPCELQILLALWLGLRRSEILALEKEDFDQEHKTVKISKALVRNEKGEWVTKGTKTALSARLIACPDYILRLVETHDSGRLYGNDPNYMLKCLHRVCKNNGLPSIRLHDLRHINASIGLMLGVPDKYMMERGGWAGTETMKYRYEHTYSEEKANADNTINAFFVDLLNK